jgi:hypothetical protein
LTVSLYVPSATSTGRGGENVAAISMPRAMVATGSSVAKPLLRSLPVAVLTNTEQPARPSRPSSFSSRPLMSGSSICRQASTGSPVVESPPLEVPPVSVPESSGTSPLVLLPEAEVASAMVSAVSSGSRVPMSTPPLLLELSLPPNVTDVPEGPSSGVQATRGSRGQARATTVRSL